MSGQPAVADSLLAFLPHRVKPGAGTTTDVDATSMKVDFLTPSGVKRDAALQKIVDRRVREDGVASPLHPQLRKLRFAVADLTADVTAPKFAGHDDTTQGGLGSLSKIACMFAAFQLKFDLEELARQKSLTSQKDLFDAARAVWADTQKRDDKNVSTLFASNPKIELLGKLIEVNGKPIRVPRPFSVPDLEQMFTVTPAGSGVSVKFKGSDKVLIDPASVAGSPHTNAAVQRYIDAGGESMNEVRKLSFAERLLLMIDDSDNAAAQSCIENVSFLYIHSALWQADLYRPERGGGLWEASTHRKDGTRWVLPPVPSKATAPGVDFVSATAASVVALLTLLEQDRLVNADACRGMRQLTNKVKTGLTRVFAGVGRRPVSSYTRSFFKEGLQPLFSLDRIHSKLGIGDHLNDGAIIVRTATSVSDPTVTKQLRYVAAGFDTDDPDDLHTLIVELDKCIQEHNGLITAATP
jgi:hypothetical protein